MLTYIKYAEELLPTKVDISKAISSYISVRNNVYHAQRILVKCTSRHLFRYGRLVFRATIRAAIRAACTCVVGKSVKERLLKVCFVITNCFCARRYLHHFLRTIQ